MAILNIKVEDKYISRITTAFKETYGIPGTAAGLQQHLVKYIKQTVKHYEGMKAGSKAQQTAEHAADEITIS